MLQQALFGDEELGKSKDDEIEGIPCKPTKADYYAAMSSLQKFVRRGMAEEAKASARVMFNVGPYKLKRRYGIIVLEDIGLGDLAFTLSAMEELNGRLTWQSYEDLIDRSCAAIKSRDGDDTFFVFKEENDGRRIPYDEIDRAELDWLRPHVGYVGTDQKPDWVKIEGMAKEKSKKLASVVSKLKEHGGPFFGPNLSLLSIYRWDESTDWLSVPSVVENNVLQNLVMHNRYVCNVGLDFHTRYGKFVVKSAVARFGVEEYALYSYHFARVSGLIDRGAVFSINYPQLMQKIYSFGDEERLKLASNWIGNCISLAAKSYEDDRIRQSERGEFMK